MVTVVWLLCSTNYKALMLEHVTLTNRNPNIIVVSYAQGEPYETTMQQLLESATSVGNANKFIGWKKQDLMTKYADLNATWDHFVRRPACMAMKSTIVLDAMETHDDGDWIIWIDSSKYYLEPLTEDLRKVTEDLERLGHNALPGMPLCQLVNVDYSLVDFEVFRVMDLNVPDYWFAPHYQNNMFIFKNSQQNRKFVSEWKMYNLMLDGACLSHTQDQAIFSLLVKKYDLPAFNLCTNRVDTPDTTSLKNANWIFRELVMKTPDVTFQSPIDVTKSFIKNGWFPQPEHLVSTEFCFKPFYP